MRILVVDDASEATELLRRGLEQEGLIVDALDDPRSVEPGVRDGDYDAVLVEAMLREGSGVALCRALRDCGCETPILLMSACPSVTDRVTGLDSGADDYLVKPLALEELLARIRALLRRAAGERRPILQVADLAYDPASRAVCRGERRIVLTAKEEAILEFLLRRAGQVVTRASLSRHVWPEERDNLTNLIDVHISKIRRKVNAPGELPLIHTVRGRGYVVAPRGRGPRSPVDAVASATEA